MKFIPAWNMVLIKPAMTPEKSPGGIVIPDSARVIPDEGIIQSIGPDVTRFKKGERVIYGKYVGMELNIPEVGDGVLLLHETDIYGRIEK
uniref:Putative chaperonin n=1 Tax=viral metagenome TaxID=1070528 RepID=A0A6H2A3V2_9ZZZZ